MSDNEGEGGSRRETYQSASASPPRTRSADLIRFQNALVNAKTDHPEAAQLEEPPPANLRALIKQFNLLKKNYLRVEDAIHQWPARSNFVYEDAEYAAAQLTKFSVENEAIERKFNSICEDDADWAVEALEINVLKDVIMIHTVNCKWLINQRPSNNVEVSSPLPQVKVTPFKEKVDLPSFDGTYSRWMSFRDIFLHKVKVEKMTSGASKLVLLLTKLTGDALSVISSYSPTDSNFESAWKDLEERYSNKREIAFSHLKEFDGLKGQSEESPSGIRKVLDILKETTRSIVNLGAPNTWDLLFIFLASKKLDGETRKQWALEDKSEFPSLTEFTKFLEKRAKALMEAPGTTNRNQNNQNQGSGHGRRNTNHVSTAPPPNNTNPVSSDSPPSNTNRPSNQGSNPPSTPVGCPGCDSKEHSVFKCEYFMSLSIEERRGIIQKKNLCFNCFSPGHGSKKCTRSKCRVCHQKHHTLIHKETRAADPPVPPCSIHHNVQPSTPQSSSSHCTPAKEDQVVKLLGTLLVQVMDSKGQPKQVRVFVDSGSETHFISESCISRLGLKRKKSCVRLSGIGGCEAPPCKGQTDLVIKNHKGDFTLSINALILDKVANLIPRYNCRMDWPHLKGLQLSDPTFGTAGTIDILLGAPTSSQILLPQKVVNHHHVEAPVAFNTPFGWIVMGASPILSQSSHVSVRSHHVSCHSVHEELNHSITKFWELEEPKSKSSSPIMSSLDLDCEEHFAKTHSTNEDGSYTVRLPFKDPPLKLGDSKTAARSRFLKLENKFQKDPTLKKEYTATIQLYRDLGYLEPVPEIDLIKPDSMTYTIPHHCVVKLSSSSTSHRVVFDASTKTSSGVSLNDTLLTGPKLQVDLQPILIQFMGHRVAISADIWKFYLQTHVHPLDRDFQRFLWQESPVEPLKVMRMTRVTFGLTAAPFLAIRSLHHLADTKAHEFPKAAQIIKEQFLVDNLLAGADSDLEALQLKQQLMTVLSSGNLKLSKWASHSKAILDSVDPDTLEKSRTLSIGDSSQEVIKTIGINWNPHQDSFHVQVVVPPPSLMTTKRSVLSTIARTFDPLGWLSPVTVRPRILLQEIWTQNLDWDQPLPLELHVKWRSYFEELTLLNKFKIPRWILPIPHPSSKKCSYELHGFSDGSDAAYAACIYTKVTDEEGRVSTRLIMGKTKVNPILKQSTPRSELCGAALLSTSMDSIIKSLPHVTFSSIRCWTDSTVVLGRLNPEKKLPIFELNRVRKILSLFPSKHWGHVRGEENPADPASRGISASELLTHPLWLKGPPWLAHHVEPPPSVINIHHVKCDYPEAPPLTLEIQNISKLTKMRIRMAYIMRFIHNLKCHVKSRKGSKRVGPISAVELKEALTTIVKAVQWEEFQPELLALQSKKGILPNRVKFLCPFLDKDGIVRVGGRLSKSHVPFEKKHPALLPKNHHLVEVLAEYYHRSHLHAGPNLLLSLLREHFWVIRGPDLVKRVTRKCVTCRKFSPSPHLQLMGQLPPSRVNPSFPFIKVGVDLAGPYHLSLRTGRSPPTAPYYVALYVCMATKAIHLEMVSDLTTSSFIASLTRFISRRGKPTDMYSDVGTIFVGARNELQEIQVLINSQSHQHQVSLVLGEQCINFHHNPPASPHHGGLWEAGVKAMKRHLKRVMGTRTLTVEEFSTLLHQVEAVLNSRPLTPLSADPSDLEALTPGHFLIGRPLTSIPQEDQSTTKDWSLSRWRHVQKMPQQFWSRWSKEYLTLLNSRPKWFSPLPNLEPGMLVLFNQDDDAFHPQAWKLARIIKTYPGSDGKVRVCDLRTKCSMSNPQGVTIKRPVTKISMLPFYGGTQQL